MHEDQTICLLIVFGTIAARRKAFLLFFAVLTSIFGYGFLIAYKACELNQENEDGYCCEKNGILKSTHIQHYGG